MQAGVRAHRRPCAQGACSGVTVPVCGGVGRDVGGRLQGAWANACLHGDRLSACLMCTCVCPTEPPAHLHPQPQI